MITQVQDQHRLDCRYRVWLDGREVTTETFRADSLRGEVWCYKRNHRGHFFVHGGGVAQERRTGRVEIRREILTIVDREFVGGPWDGVILPTPRWQRDLVVRTAFRREHRYRQCRGARRTFWRYDGLADAR